MVRDNHPACIVLQLYARPRGLYLHSASLGTLQHAPSASWPSFLLCRPLRQETIATANNSPSFLLAISTSPYFQASRKRSSILWPSRPVPTTQTPSGTPSDGIGLSHRDLLLFANTLLLRKLLSRPLAHLKTSCKPSPSSTLCPFKPQQPVAVFKTSNY